MYAQLGVIKDNLFDTPPVFSLIQSEGQTKWREMYQVSNHCTEPLASASVANGVCNP